LYFQQIQLFRIVEVQAFRVPTGPSAQCSARSPGHSRTLGLLITCTYILVVGIASLRAMSHARRSHILQMTLALALVAHIVEQQLNVEVAAAPALAWICGGALLGSTRLANAPTVQIVSWALQPSAVGRKWTSSGHDRVPCSSQWRWRPRRSPAGGSSNRFVDAQYATALAQERAGNSQASACGTGGRVIDLTC